jgi:hypothetical protein
MRHIPGMPARHDPSQARQVWPPSPGHFALKLAKGCWAVPCRIVHDDAGWHAVIDEFEHPPNADPAGAEGVSTVWTYGQIIGTSSYNWLLSVKRWAEQNYRDHPALNPRVPIDPMKLRPIMLGDKSP